MNLKYLLFISIVFFQQISSAYYLFAEKSIEVREGSSRRSGVIHTIKTGETFEVIKWNKHNTRIRLSDGTIGFINKEHVAAYAPADNNGYLVDPLSLTTTTRKTDMYRQRPSVSTDYKPQGNAEFSDDDIVDDVPEDTMDDESDYIFMNSEAEDKYKESASPKQTTSKPGLVELLAKKSWYEATRKRQVAGFMGGGWRSGNQSKGMCAGAVKDALLSAGICSSRPAGNAYDSHTSGSLAKSCPGLKLSKAAQKGQALSVNDIASAPGGSVIVYNGYAGRRKHNYGHIEIKVPVTAELQQSMKRNGLSVSVGQFIYCSDFCRSTPTKKPTNSVQAIYTL